MRKSVFVFGTDLVDEGTEQVLENLQSRATASDVIFSATYHDARDVFPHNPRRRIYRHEGDIAWFKARRDEFPRGCAPKLADDADGRDMLGELCAEADARGMSVSAWTIFLHNSRLGAQRPAWTMRNVLGDAYLSDLCPANPEVRQYCRTLALDVARYPVQRLMAEALHYRTMEHGEHHERYLITLPGWARGLMSLCFCPHCCAAGKADGIDMEGLAQAIRDALEPIWQGRTPTIGQRLDPAHMRDLERFRQTRCDIVSSLVGEVKTDLAPTGVALSFIDHAGVMAQVLPGVTPKDDIVDVAREVLGTDPVTVAAICDEFTVLGYTETGNELARQLRRYRAVLGSEIRLTVALRPLDVDCRSPGNLADKVAAARAAGASGLAFYHYAMMPLNRLDWISAALDGKEQG